MAHARRTFRSAPHERRRIDPKRAIVLHRITDGPAKGWIHTHGLAAHGKPELEMRKVPLFLGAAAARVLNDVADYLLNDATAPLVAGELVQLGASSIRVVEGRPDAEAGYDPAHYVDGVRLVLEDPPDDGCMCAKCAEELSRRSRLAS